MTNKIEEFLDKEKEKHSTGTFNSLEFKANVKKLLDEVCGEGCKYDPLQNVESSHNQYTTVATFLFDREFKSLAVELLVEWWDKLAELQAQDANKNKHILRSHTSMKLAEFYFKLRDKGAALRWALLTHADDILHGNNATGGGVQMLRGRLGMTELELSRFEEIARQNKTNIETAYEGDWSVQEGFAEDIVVRFALKNPGFANLLAQESFMSEFPLSKTYFGKLLELARKKVKKNDNPPDGITTKEKGDYLEYLASYLFLLIPGWVPLRNREDEYKTFENDIVVRNFSQNAYTTDLVGRHFLVECKNWETAKMKSPHVGYFLHRMQLTHANFGVIFAWSGITDSPKEDEKKYATNLIQKTFHEIQTFCVVIEEKHLEEIACGKKTFWSLLLELIEEFRFGNSKANQTL